MAQHSTHEVFTDTGKVAMRGVLNNKTQGEHVLVKAAFAPVAAASHMNSHQTGFESPVFDPFFGGEVAL